MDKTELELPRTSLNAALQRNEIGPIQFLRYDSMNVARDWDFGQPGMRESVPIKPDILIVLKDSESIRKYKSGQEASKSGSPESFDPSETPRYKHQDGTEAYRIRLSDILGYGEIKWQRALKGRSESLTRNSSAEFLDGEQLTSC